MFTQHDILRSKYSDNPYAGRKLAVEYFLEVPG